MQRKKLQEMTLIDLIQSTDFVIFYLTNSLYLTIWKNTPQNHR